MKHFKGIVYSDVEPSHDFLWIKPLENNLNDFYLYDKGWEKIDNSSKAITAINKSLERIDEIIGAMSHTTINGIPLLNDIKNPNSNSIEIPIIVRVPQLTSDYLIQSFNDNIERIYIIPVGEHIYSIFGDSTIKWRDGAPPAIRENQTYIISVIGIYAVYGEF